MDVRSSGPERARESVCEIKARAKGLARDVGQPAMARGGSMRCRAFRRISVAQDTVGWSP